MSPIYAGFCVMKCAFIAMFVSVCKIVNFFFFWSEFFPLICNWKHSFYIQYTRCDFSSSSFPSTKTPAHLGSSMWLFPVACNSSTSSAFFNLGIGNLHLRSAQPELSPSARSQHSKPLGGGDKWSPWPWVRQTSPHVLCVHTKCLSYLYLFNKLYQNIYWSSFLSSIPSNNLVASPKCWLLLSYHFTF